MMLKENLVLVWAIVHYLSPVVFFILSKINLFKVDRRTLLNNYFTYFVIFQCAFILFARIIFIDQKSSFWVFENILFLGLPLITMIVFAFKKESFLWFYLVFSIGTIIYYVLNAFEPNMSLSKNLNVILEHLVILVLYFWYLNRNFKDEFSKSFKAFKIWLLDFDKKEAFWALAPFLAILILGVIILLIIIFKFRHVIAGRVI